MVMVKNIDDVLFIVQARLGSTRIPNKMIKPFAGSNLLNIILEKVSNSIIPHKNFFLSVYEKELKKIGKENNVNIFHRSKKSAFSEGTPLTDMYEWWDMAYKYVILINGCNPLLKVDSINNFIQSYLSHDFGGEFGVIEKKSYYWNEDGECITPLKEDVMNTKTANIIYEAGHCLYASEMKIISQGKFMGNFTKNNPKLFVMDELELFDIDYPWQFILGEQIYEYYNSGY